MNSNYCIKQNSIHISQEFKVILECVELCCKVAKQLRTCFDNNIVSKLDDSPVTVADFSAQLLINHCLKSNYPDDFVISEEDSKSLKRLDRDQIELILRTIKEEANIIITFEEVFELLDHGKNNINIKNRIWTIDPIDGTKGYLRNEQYAVCVSLLIDNEVEFGCIGAPNLNHSYFDNSKDNNQMGIIFYAEKDKGAYKIKLNNNLNQTHEEIKVSETNDFSNIRLCESYESSHSNESIINKVMQVLNTKSQPIRIDSQCKYGLIASGIADVYLRIPTNESYVEKIWDHAGGYLIVKEAGGVVSDMNGKDLDFKHGAFLQKNKGIIATNKYLYPTILKTLSKYIK